jgi:Mg/Co/Ni transporter MgtE
MSSFPLMFLPVPFLRQWLSVELLSSVYTGCGMACVVGVIVYVSSSLNVTLGALIGAAQMFAILVLDLQETWYPFDFRYYFVTLV